MAIPFEKDKKRIIILDKDLVSIPSEGVRCFMKKVLGRHYDNLKNKGSGWSFPAFQEPALKDWEASLFPKEEEVVSVVTISTQTDPEIPLNTAIDASTQTDLEQTPPQGVYRFDIDPSLKWFGKQWLMG